MVHHTASTDAQIRKKIRKSSFEFAGNATLKIFGKLNCASGKRVKRTNRVFFNSREEAIKNSFRPCGHCLKAEYKNWKNESI